MSRGQRPLERGSTRASIDPAHYDALSEWIGAMRGLAALAGTAPHEAIDSLDVVEGMTVHYAVRLIPLLAHADRRVRARAMLLLEQLVRVFATLGAGEVAHLRGAAVATVDAKDAVRLLGPLMMALGARLQPLVVPLVAGLEACYLSSKSVEQQSALTVVPCLIITNRKHFVDVDRLTAVWNLFFTLDTPTSEVGLIGTDERRLAVCRALEFLAPVYVNNVNLCEAVIERLLQLTDKTLAEEECIKTALIAIFSGTRDSLESQAPALIFSVFRLLLTSHNESHYDLLAWALRTAVLVLSKQPLSTADGSAVQVELYPPLVDLVNSLENHLRASQPLIRYGALLCIHTAAALCPGMLAACSARIVTEIVSGILDADPSVASLCVAVIELFAAERRLEQLTGLIGTHHEQLLHAGERAGYRTATRHALDSSAVDGVPPTLLAVALEAGRHVVPVTSRQLQALANALPHVPPVHLARQFALLRLWCHSAKAADPLLLAALLGRLRDAPSPVMFRGVLAVVRSLAPAAENLEERDVGQMEAYLRQALSATTDAALQIDVLDTLAVVPLVKLGSVRLEQLLAALVPLLSSPSRSLRASTYDMLGACAALWRRSTVTLDYACALLLLCLGDSFPDNVVKVLDNLDLLLNDNRYPDARAALTAHRVKLLARDVHDRTAVMNRMSEILLSTDALRPLTVAIIESPLVRGLWQTLVEDTNNTGTSHRPHWLSLVMTRLGIAAPQVKPPDYYAFHVAHTDDRRPPLPYGALTLLEPACASPDGAERRGAALLLVQACFEGQAVSLLQLRHVLAACVHHISAVAQTTDLAVVPWSAMWTAFTALTMLLTFRLPHLHATIVAGFAESAVDTIETHPEGRMREVAADFLNIALTINSTPFENRLDRIRDALRELISSKKFPPSSAYTRAYSTVFRVVPARDAANYLTFVRNDMAPALGKKTEKEADPLLAKLNPAQIKRVLLASLGALAALQHGLAGQILDEFQNLLHHPDPQFRHAALTMVIAQANQLERRRAAPFLWIALPLAADTVETSQNFIRGIARHVPPVAELIYNALDARSQQRVTPPTLVDFLLGRTQALSAGSEELVRLRNHLLQPAEAAVLHDAGAKPVYLTMPPEHHVSSGPPDIDTELLGVLRAAIDDRCGNVPEDALQMVIFHLQEFAKIPELLGPAMVALSELCVRNPRPASETVVQVLLFNVTRGLDDAPHNESIVLGCSVGLRNVADASPLAFQKIMGHFNAEVSAHTTAVLSEGELIALRHLVGCLERYATKEDAHRLVAQYTSHVTAPNISASARRAAMEVVGELALIGGTDDISAVIRTIAQLLDESADPTMREICESQLSRFLDRVGITHPLIQKLLAMMASDVRHHEASHRVRGLAQLTVFARFLPEDEVVGMLLLLLADKDDAVLEATVAALAQKSMSAIPCLASVFAYALEQNNEDLAAEAHAAEMAALEPINATAAEDETQVVEALLVPMKDRDPLNQKYFLSEGHRLFLSRYGLAAEDFLIHTNYDGSAAKRPDTKGTARLRAIPPLRYMRALLVKHPKHGATLMTELSGYVSKTLTQNVDYEQTQHYMDVYIALMRGCDGLQDLDATSYVRTLHEFIRSCNDKAKIVREGMFDNIQKARFLHSDYVDVPITSQAQYDSMEAHRQALEGAALDTVKAERMAGERRKLNVTLEQQSGELRSLNGMLYRVIAAVGTFYQQASHSVETVVMEGYRLLMTILPNQHRGIRHVVTQALVSEAHTHIPNFASFRLEIDRTIVSLHKQLQEGSASLYRMRGDYMYLLAHLLHYCTTPMLRAAVVTMLLDNWDAPDGAVRRLSIELVQHLCERKLPEMNPYLEAAQGGTAKLITAIMKRTSDPDYLDKDALTKVLQWYFSQYAPHVGSRSII